MIKFLIKCLRLIKIGLILTWQVTFPKKEREELVSGIIALTVLIIFIGLAYILISSHPMVAAGLFELLLVALLVGAIVNSIRKKSQ